MIQPIQFNAWQQMMGHLFLVVDGFSRRQWPNKFRDHLTPVGLMMSNDFAGTGVGETSFPQVMCVEWLIAHDRVGSITPCPHHGGGDVPRTGPHRQAQYWGHV